MIEPTEMENLDAFVAAMERIARLAETDPEALRTASHTTPVVRLDEVLAARKPDLAEREEKTGSKLGRGWSRLIRNFLISTPPTLRVLLK